MAQAVIKGGRLLLPHDAGCGATEISPDDPRYERLSADAVVDEDLNGTHEQAADIAARWRRNWSGLGDRRTA